MSRRIEPYWYAIGAVFAVAAALFVRHLLTGAMPPRAALTVLGLPLYWYAIWIITGIALGTWVVSRLADERAERLFAAAVPAAVRDRPLTDAGLPDDVVAHLTARHYTTLGAVLRDYGFDPRRLGLKRAETEAVGKALAAAPDVAPAWLADAPWRPWNPDHAWNALFIILTLSLIGARLYHVLTPSPSMAPLGITSALDYFRNPTQLFNFRAGGLGVYGGIAGGLLGLILYTRRNRLPVLGWADLSVVGLALGQAVGRWGNFFNQELYGRPSNLPWAITIDPIYRLDGYKEFARFHPAFLYESLWSLVTFLLLLWLARRRAERLLPGELMAIYLIAYAVGRSLLELVRLDSRTATLLGVDTGMAVATLVSIGVALVAALSVLLRQRRRGGVG